MSQENSKQKRRWLKRILSARASTALWLAPALLAPVITTNCVETANAQTTSAARSITDSGSAVNVEFVSGWLELAAKQAEAGDIGSSAKSFAEALRGRQLLGAKDAKVEARLKEVETLLLGKGMRKQQIVDAIGSLGAIASAPNMAAAPSGNQTATGSAQPALPGKPTGPAAPAGQMVSTTPASGTLPSLPGMLPPLPSATTTTPSLPVVPASSTNPVQSSHNAQTAQGIAAAPGRPVEPSVFFPANDQTTVSAASTQAQMPARDASGDELYRRGVELLSQGERDAAYEQFRRAWQFEREMDPSLRMQLKDKLSSLSASPSDAEPSASPLQRVSDEEMAIRQRLMSEVTTEIANAEANREAEPQVAAERLQTLRIRVSQANLDANARKQMLTIVDRAITSHQIYMTQNRSAIEQNMRNRQITEQMSLDQEQRFKIDQQIASLVETYNDLMDKGSFAEAEVVAKQVGVLDRNSTIASLLISNARNARRIGEYEAIKGLKEDGFIDNMLTVDEAAIPFDDREPLLFPSAKKWAELTKQRLSQQSESKRGMSPAEQKIWSQLDQPVMVDFRNRPLGEVVNTLSDMTGVLMYIDEVSLANEGMTTDSTVTLSLPSQITFKSALNLLLNSQNLDYQVRNEVLMITSARQTAQANVQRTYNVRDLVIPIPNFVTDNNSGMAGALRHAYETLNRGLVAQNPNSIGSLSGGNAMLASTTSVDPNSPALGQLVGGMPGVGNLPGMGGVGGMGGIGPGGASGGFGGMSGGSPMSMGNGAIGGGAAMADFATLINLIQTTIDPDGWLANGGTSSMLEYPANLSLVVSAPQTTHERITELLESLRRLQDLQVTIEVKFITLNDNFFERMGVDFDFRIDDNVRRLPQDDQGNSAVVGLSGGVTATEAFPVTADFDIAFTQDGFASAVPAFGNFDATSGGSIGFAILSDLEMFFFMNAAQGDQRTNVLQAPRVTMFDGQFASINDTISRPFVTSLIPVVADFAVAQQPVIVVLNEGTVLNVQATVSPDKRFVRLTLNPTFSQIDRVDTFTFEGSRTTRNNSSRTGNNLLDPAGNVTGDNEDQEVITTGTTVQQPSFAQTSISTTVSVPDGGTILLGGIKRMREGRLERGVPILSKIPYVNRLFKNTAIGRETSTLMMTVTPRIIIQEEEEQKYGVNP